jgi:hypothetical protein
VILEAHGVRIELPRGWSGRLFERDGATGLHAGDYQLPLEDTSTFGDASTARIPAGGTFVALVEYLPGNGLAPGHGLFAPRRLSLPLDPTAFSERGLAHPRPGQLGCQHFFTVSGRPFCAYVVLASGAAGRRRQLAAVTAVLRTLRVEPRRVRDSTA